MAERTSTADLLRADRTYTRKQLLSEFQTQIPTLKEGTFQWSLGALLKAGELVKTGYDSYRLPDGNAASSYAPQYSELAKKIMETLQTAYPGVKFTVFETVLMNEFLNHLIAQNTVFVSVEKDIAPYTFRSLKELGYPNVMLNPGSKELSLYWSPDSVVVTDMISEAPLNKTEPHHITIEKLLVDIYCDKRIAGTYSLAEYPSVLKQAAEKYKVDFPRLCRYARRRNHEKEIVMFFNESDE